MKSKLTLGILLAIGLQLFVLCGMQIHAALPLWIGTEIKVKTVPVDPRSLFRGNYARLSYGLSRVNENDIVNKSGKKIRIGEVVFASLKPSHSGLHELDSISLERPVNGPYLRGRISERHYSKIPITNTQVFGHMKHYSGRNSFNYDINYGIEAYFAPKEKALGLERELADSGVAILMVSPGGKARIKAIKGN